MIRLGVVRQISSGGIIIVKAESTLPKGSMAVDERLRQVGRVMRVFGPVKAPYVSIAPARKDPQWMLSLIGKELFTNGGNDNVKTKKDRRK